MTSRYFDPEGLARLGNMELVARQVVEGFLAGRHRSPYHGFSVEYLDHRPYSPGDEIRSLDWKLLARTDKYFVKLFEEETNLRATILLDCSRSMTFQSGRLSKLEYGSYLAAALAYLMLKQNDAVGLVLFDHDIRAALMPRARPTQFRRILDLLESPPTGNDTDIGSLLHRLADRARQRGLIILISDLIDDVERLAGGLYHFHHAGHEVIVMQVLDSAEKTLPADRLTRFKDMESNARLVANPKALRSRYSERLQLFLDQVQSACLERRISYHRAETTTPYSLFLAAYLDQRARLG
jgi:uncharacterized protein (DUF58 family)